MRSDGTAETWRDFLPLSAVLGVGLVLATMAFVTVRGYYQTQAQQQFRRSATYYSTSFKDDVARHVTSLAAIRAFVSASKGMTRWEFSTYAHQILPQNLGLRAVLWVPYVAQQNRAAYEDELQQDGLFGLRIRELAQQENIIVAGNHPSYLPISYVEPFDGNDNLVGLDLSPIPLFDNLFRTAQQTGHVAASAPTFRGIVAGTHGPVVLLAFPLNASPVEPAAKGMQATPPGYALGVLQLEALIAEAIGPSAAPVQAVIGYQDNSSTAPMVLDSDKAVSAATWFQQAAFHQIIPFDIAGRSFLLVLRSTGHADPVTSLYVPVGAGLLVILLTAFLAQNMFITIQRKRSVERAVVLRTAELTAANATLRDEVEQRRQAEAALRVARDRAESANRAKSSFMANMSHELRTPLNAIIGFSSILFTAENGGAEHSREYAGEILGSGRHLLELINDILDLTQMDSQSDGQQDTLIYPSDCAMAAFQEAEPAALAAGVLLRVSVPDCTPALYGDSKRLTKALSHLVANAVKFTPRGGLAVVTAARGAHGTLILDVTDTGIGMPPDAMARINQAFSQHDSKLARRYEGIGLGLTYVGKVVELHEAELEIVSEAGKGTRVRLIFPAQRIAENREVA